jgi:sec-independent protein translocase protein TatC
VATAQAPANAKSPADYSFAEEIFKRLGIPTTYLAHLRELRQRLIRVMFTVGFFYAFFFLFELVPAGELYGVTLYAPQFSPFHPFAGQVLERLINDIIPSDIRVFQVSPYEVPVLYVQIALTLSAVCSMPMILYQFGRFVIPALYPHERRVLARLIGPGLFLFAVGAIFAYTVVLPPLVNFMFEYSRELAAGTHFELTVSVAEAISFALVLILAFGVVFEMPLVMNLLTRIGIVQARTWWRFWRHAIVGFLIVGGFITPDTSGVTQLLVSVPMIGLYLGGAASASLTERRAREREAKERRLA